jgi:hypothetical protein
MNDHRIGETVILNHPPGKAQEVIVSGRLEPRRAKGWDKQHMAYEVTDLNGSKLYAMPEALLYYPTMFDSRKVVKWEDLSHVWSPKRGVA